MDLAVTRTPDGDLSVTGIGPVLTALLVELPSILTDDRPAAASARLFPAPSDDADVAAEWRRTEEPELFALVASARDVVAADLAKLRRGRGISHRIDIAGDHVAAWISALNAARLTLGAVHEVTAEDLDPDRPLPDDARGAAIARIDHYGWFQAVLIDATDADG